MKEKTTRAGQEDSFVEPFNVNYIPERIGRWIIDIDDGIASPAQFQLAIRALEMADEDNPVQINLQSPGGSLGAADALIHAMHKCKGHIHVIGTGNCSSAASLILLAANSFELSEGFSSLIHCGSLGAIGTLSEYTSQSAFDSQFMANYLRKHYEGFLTEAELENMLKGQDIWLDSVAWCERHNKRNEYFLAKEAAARSPAKKSRKKTAQIPAEL